MFESLGKLKDDEFDLAGLVEVVNRLIDQAGWAPQDERAAERLDPRNVRYYQTLGLVSRPGRYEGRRARYTYQHVLQLVAIKALQAQGLSLAQIQAWLPAQPVEALQAALAGSLTETSERLFAAPMRASPAPPSAQVQEAADQYTPAARPRSDLQAAGLSAFRLAPGITLLVDPALVDDPHGLASWLKSLLEEHA